MFGLGYTFLGFFGFITSMLLLAIIVVIALMVSGSQINWVQILRDKLDKIISKNDKEMNPDNNSSNKENTKENDGKEADLSVLGETPQKGFEDEFKQTIRSLKSKQSETESYLKTINEEISNLRIRIEKMEREIRGLTRQPVSENSYKAPVTSLSHNTPATKASHSIVKFATTPHKSKRGFALHRLTNTAEPRSIYKISFSNSDHSTGILEFLTTEDAVSFLLNHPEDLLNPVAEAQNQRPEQPNGLVMETPGKVSLQNEYYIVTEPIKIRYI
jgi:uncharacterized coiled-coil protein SlyX